MRANQTEFINIIALPNTTFVIPVYQRNYDWRMENCKQLFNDILKIVNSDEYHFIGTICRKKSEKNQYVIIDGQQRITSIMLLLKAIHDITLNRNLKCKIQNQFLINQYNENTNKLKLKPIKKDESVFNKLIMQETFDENCYDFIEKNSNIYRNYILFKELILNRTQEKIENQNICEEIAEAIERLQIVDLELDNENPQVIFESLNSTGLDLTNIDLIRNYILMALPYKDQERLYLTYWMPIEELLGMDVMENFIVHYTIFKKRNTYINIESKNIKISSNNIYKTFKQIYGYINVEKAERLFIDMYKYAQYYAHFTKDNSYSHDLIDKKLNIIFNILESNDTSILLLYLYEEYETDKINREIFNHLLDYIICYIFRCAVCGKSGMSKIFATQCLQKLIYELESNKKVYALLKDNKNKEYEDIFLNVLNSGRGDSSWPKDKEFVDTLRKKDIYNSLKGKKGKYLLYTIDNYFNKKECPNFEDATIEHIMPATLSKDWKNYLNEKNDLMNYENALNILGNLTLTGYNPELSNKNFEKKKDIYYHSAFTITRDICSYKEWTSKEIEKRGNNLALIAQQCWKIPHEFNNEATIDTGITYNLKCDASMFTWTKPNEITIMGKQYDIKNWNDLLVIIAKEFYYIDKYLFLELIEYDGFPGRKKIISTIDYGHMEKIDSNLYIDTSNSAKTNLEIARAIVSYFDTIERTNFMDEITFTLRKTRY